MRIRRTGAIAATIAAAGILGAAPVIVSLRHTESPPPFAAASDLGQEAGPSIDRPDGRESPFREPLLLDGVGCNQPDPPPVIFFWGRSPDHEGDADFNTPAAAVQSALSLIDRDGSTGAGAWRAGTGSLIASHRSG